MAEFENNNLFDDDDFSIDNPKFKSQPTEYKHTKQNVKKKKKRGCSVWVWLVGIVVVSVGLAVGIISVSFDYLGLRSGNSGEIVVDIKEGTSGKEVARILKDSGAIDNEFLFRVFSKLNGYDAKYKYGVYTMTNELSYSDIADKLQNEGAKAESVKVTIPERATIDEMAKLLEEKGVCTAKDFKNAVQNGEFKYDFVEKIPAASVHYRFEGYLFPDTYDFYSYDSATCARLAVDKMLKQTNDKIFTEDNAKRAEKLGYSMHEIMTMASIVELEASGSPKEMPNVAAVFYNRLKWDDRKTLGSSPTADYPYGDGRYDTNKTEGLPPGPECAPSINSVNAALSPTANFTYTYFVTDKNMKFYYTSSFAEHKAIIAKLKSQGMWA